MPAMRLSEMEHAVQFYQKETFLLDALVNFIGDGLGKGAVCLVIATPAHREALAGRLLAKHIELTSVQDSYFVLDAASTLGQILVGGEPDAQRLTRVISSVIGQATKLQKRVCVFEEMVTLLWQQEKQVAALRLEALWNELCATTHVCSLLCAYPMSLFVGQEHEKSFTHVCNLHARVTPDESYSAFARTEVRQRAVSLFQQKALSLDAEVAEHRATEQRLRQSEERYRRLFEASTDGILMVDPYSGRILDANPFMVRLLRSTREQVVEQELWQVGLMANRAGQQEFCQRVQQDRVSPSEIIQLVRKDGDYRWVEWVSTLFRVSGQAMLQCNVRDVTDRVRAEEQERFLSEMSRILASTLDYQDTLANMARLVVPRLADWFSVELVDANGRFELVQTEHRDQELVKLVRAYREKVKPPDPDAPFGAPYVVRTGKSELYPEITDEMLVDGVQDEELLALVRQVGVRSVMNVPLVARGRVIGVVTFVSSKPGKKYDKRDLALAEEVGRRAGVAFDQARLHREVQQARDQLTIILQGVADGILVYDKDGHIIYANEAAAELNGFTSVEELLATPAQSLLSRYEMVDERSQPFSRSQLAHRRVLAGEAEAEVLIGYVDKTARERQRWSFVKSRPVSDERGEVLYVISIIHDMTERVRVEQRKEEFIDMASRELKEPIASLKDLASALRLRLGEQGDEQGLECLSRMDVQLDRLSELVGDFHGLSGG